MPRAVITCFEVILIFICLSEGVTGQIRSIKGCQQMYNDIRAYTCCERYVDGGHSSGPLPPICCSGIAHWRFINSGTECCGTTPYDPAVSVCDTSYVRQKAVSPTTFNTTGDDFACCGNLRTSGSQQVCSGQVLKNSESVFNTPSGKSGCCGNRKWIGYKWKCCNGHIVRRYGRHTSCCGQISFNYYEKMCCSGVLNYRFPIHLTSTSCCGTRVYNERTQKCIAPNLVCPLSYNPSLSVCCYGAVAPRATHFCCGGYPYHKLIYRCCHSSPYNKYISKCSAGNQVVTDWQSILQWLFNIFRSGLKN